MVMNRRAQFFLLAAVIISAVVISLGVVENSATVSKEPESFYDFNYEVKREAGAVLDYSVYTGFSGDADLDEFVDLLVEEAVERNPGASFLFIYGDSEGMELKNYRDDSVYVGDDEIPGHDEDVVSKVCFGKFCQDVPGSEKGSPGLGYLKKKDIKDSEDVVVSVGGNEFSFPISEYQQVIFIMQKDVNDESFVAIG